MKQSTKLAKIIELSKKAKRIAIFAHSNYDIDCLGSMYGLGSCFKRMGKQVDMFLDDEITQIDAKLFSPKLLASSLGEYDLIFSVDSANAKRLGKYTSFFMENKSKTIRLDHHKGINHDTGIEFTNDNFSSCSELILSFIEMLNKKPNKDEANYLFAGLMSDTCNLTNSNCTLESYKNAAKLIEYGADNVNVSNILRSMALSAKKIESRMVDKLEVFDSDIGFSSITIKDFKACGAKDNECKNFASTLLNIEGINIACLIKQKSLRSFSVSLRSRAGYNVLTAAKVLGGGGHTNAAGCVLSGSEKQVKEQVLKAIKENR